MKIPILGKIYTVERSDNAHLGGQSGASQWIKQQIVINETASEAQQKDTIIHEVLHMIDLELQLGLDEPTIARLAVGLHSAGFESRLLREET